MNEATYQKLKRKKTEIAMLELNKKLDIVEGSKRKIQNRIDVKKQT